tara:strand:- start:435 stop:1202 length:768 start_codon:yes stop_codon:yes gene_type:complete
MRIFILCGGFGTRLDNEGKLKAKPMIKIGNKTVLMHLIETFVYQGHNDFVICMGHKYDSIVKFFIKNSNVKVLFKKNKNYKILYNKKNIKFTADLVYTGLNTGTGGRIAIAYKYLNLDEDFLVTYGDGLSNVNINKLIKFHYSKNSFATVTAVRPKERYGVLKLETRSSRITNLDESKQHSNSFINGGYFILSKEIIKKIKNNQVYFEQETLNKEIIKKRIFAFKHLGFWKSLDTLKDKNDFNKIIKNGKKPWLN